ncbi:MAG: hypothetical protein E7588_07135 [Ruminococcaceae bacterium]|nr:hypothetical protein [Oscillospiraceae bacterium]
MENSLLANRISDAVYNARERYMSFTLGFCDEKEQCEITEVLKSLAFHDYMFWGGYNDAERKCLGIFPDTPNRENFPISFLKFTADKFSSLSHRDCMGAILGCGVKREILGDIVLTDDKTAFAAIYDEDNMAQYLCGAVSKIGRATVKCTLMPEGFVPDIQRKFENISFTVSSIRLDSVVAGAVHASRSGAVSLISEGKVTLNHNTATRPDISLKPGDVFSVHKKGKFIFEQNGGLTKKDKIRINLKKYL